MRYILLLSLLFSVLLADRCQELYERTKIEFTKSNTLIKSNIPSHKTYEIINNYLDLASLTVAECSLIKKAYGFRIIRELNANMKRVSVQRERFRVQTFEALKKEAMIQAKKEVQCTNIYNNTYIRRPKKDEEDPKPIKK